MKTPPLSPHLDQHYRCSEHTRPSFRLAHPLCASPTAHTNTFIDTANHNQDTNSTPPLWTDSIISSIVESYRGTSEDPRKFPTRGEETSRDTEELLKSFGSTVLSEIDGPDLCMISEVKKNLGERVTLGWKNSNTNGQVSSHGTIRSRGLDNYELYDSPSYTIRYSEGSEFSEFIYKAPQYVEHLEKDIDSIDYFKRYDGPSAAYGDESSKKNDPFIPLVPKLQLNNMVQLERPKDPYKLKSGLRNSPECDTYQWRCDDIETVRVDRNDDYYGHTYRGETHSNKKEVIDDPLRVSPRFKKNNHSRNHFGKNLNSELEIEKSSHKENINKNNGNNKRKANKSECEAPQNKFSKREPTFNEQGPSILTSQINQTKSNIIKRSIGLESEENPSKRSSELPTSKSTNLPEDSQERRTHSIDRGLKEQEPKSIPSQVSIHFRTPNKMKGPPPSFTNSKKKRSSASKGSRYEYVPQTTHRYNEKQLIMQQDQNQMIIDELRYLLATKI